MLLNTKDRLTLIRVTINSLIVIFVSIYFFIVPFIIIVSRLKDENLKSTRIPAYIFEQHYLLTQKIESWAKERIVSDKAKKADLNNITTTEWPIFGSVFYLWLTENLQKEWENNPHIFKAAPKIYAREAVNTLARLVSDPKQAYWVKKQWGEDYLKKENLFYRFMLISALTSYQELTGSGIYENTLRGQVVTLSDEIDRARDGLVNDYPEECWLPDIAAAIYSIKKADRVLGLNHDGFVERARRSFSGNYIDKTTGLPVAYVNITSGYRDITRGCGNSYMLIYAPALWKDYSKRWYDLHTKQYWQKRWGAYGFREFPRKSGTSDWSFEVDAGPILAGHGIAASAFGIGAARANGRFDHAYPLMAEALAVSWPIPKGLSLITHLLSNTTEAPYVGDACLLFNYTVMPGDGLPIVKGNRLPSFVYIATALYLILGLLLFFDSIKKLVRIYGTESWPPSPYARYIFILWLVLLIVGLILITGYSKTAWGILFILLALLLPAKILIRTK